MSKVNLSEMIKRLPAEEQHAIHARAAKITAARQRAREQQDKIATEGAAKLLPNIAKSKTNGEKHG